jgi:hypothetical protein
MLLSKIVEGAPLKVYPGASDGLPTIHQNQLNAISSPSHQGLRSVRSG